jgi:uncharacterized protein (TIGR02145 family)
MESVRKAKEFLCVAKKKRNMKANKLISSTALFVIMSLTMTLVSCGGDDDSGIPILPKIGEETGQTNTFELDNLTIIERNERVIIKWTAPVNPDESISYPKIYFGEGTTAEEATEEVSMFEVFGDTLTVIAELTNDIPYVFVVKTQDALKFMDGFSGESVGVMLTATPKEMNEVLNPDLSYNTFTDTRDGESYKTIQIGTQVWMAENYRYLPSVYPSTSGVGSDDDSRYYVNGYEGSDVSAAKANIVEIHSVDWNGDGLEYQDGSNSRMVNCYDTYGVLYNWPAAHAACPVGWHLPTDEEWKTLERYLGMSASDADLKDQDRGDIAKKLAAQVAWREDGLSTNMPESIGYNFYSHNSSGFSALPGGYREGDYGGFGDLGVAGLWWSDTKDASNTVYSREMRSRDAYISRYSKYRSSGCSVRYIKD